MSATEDDTELRDLLIQNLEKNGVLNKLKAEMRAAVFLAMEEQEKLENKTPQINENLKKCLKTKDGRLVASLIMDFLQVFNLDFTFAVFQPEINWTDSLDSRDLVCRDLGLLESEDNRKCPLLLELVRRGRHRRAQVVGDVLQEPSQKHISLARNKFDFYDKDGSGSVLKEDLKNVFTDLFPGLNNNMLERFITDELRAADKPFSKVIDFQMFLGFYKRLFSQCRSVLVLDRDEGLSPEEKMSPSPVRQDSDTVESLDKGDVQQLVSRDREKKDHLDLDLDLEVQDDPDDGDSFFDDPLPKPQKTYGCLSADSEIQRHGCLSGNRKVEVSEAREGPAGSLSETPRGAGGGAGGAGGVGGGAGGSSASESSRSRNGASNSREKVFRESRAQGDDVEYDDDFNSHRSDLSRSELSIGEEIEEVSIEGPDHSDKFDESTQDLSVSQLSLSHGVDYMEEVT